MEATIINPPFYDKLVQETSDLGFTMSSDREIGSFLRTLVQSKVKGRILEIGTGTGLALSWILAGADEDTTIISLDNEAGLVEMAQRTFGQDNRVELICADGEDWLNSYKGLPFDVIFADAWPGKFELLDKTLDLLAPGGFYVIDDLNPEPTWPDGHDHKVRTLIEKLYSNDHLCLTEMNWSTGLIVATKKS